MADTFVEANPGTGGEKFAVDSDGTWKHPYAKLEWGASGTQTRVGAGADALPIQDGGNSLTVDGTVTAAQATAANLNMTEASAAAIKTAVETLDNIVAGNEAQVDVITVPTDPFGANADAASATGSISAKLRFIASTGIPITGTVTVGSHAVTNAGTFAVQVTSLPATPAGTNNIGDVDVLSLPALVAGSANIGDVDVLTVPTDPFGANADAASASGSISAKLRGIATALGITALDLGSGTGGSRTLRIFSDTAQWVGASGVDSSAVQRVSLATNVALPAGTNNIGDVDVLTIAAGDNNIGNVDIVTLPAKKITYAASAAQTQTNLDGLASSATHVAGWEGTAIDNSSNLYLDYIINAKIQVESAGLTAGEIRLYLVAELEDSTWPDVFDGTESTETVTSVGIRDAICRLAAVTATTTDASRTYYLNCPSVAYIFNGVVPRKFVPFITQSTVAALETTGDPNQVYIKGVYLT